MTQIERTTGETHPLDLRGAKSGKGGDAPAFEAMLTSLSDGTEMPIATPGRSEGKPSAEEATKSRKSHAAKGEHDDVTEQDESADAKGDAASPAAADPVGAIAMMLAAGPRSDGTASGRGGDPSTEDVTSAARTATDASATLADWGGSTDIGPAGSDADAALDAFASAAVQAGLKGLASGAGSASVVDRRTHFAPVQSRALDSAARATDTGRTSEIGQGLPQSTAAGLDGDRSGAVASVQTNGVADAAGAAETATAALAADADRLASAEIGTEAGPRGATDGRIGESALADIHAVRAGPRMPTADQMPSQAESLDVAPGLRTQHTAAGSSAAGTGQVGRAGQPVPTPASMPSGDATDAGLAGTPGLAASFLGAAQDTTVLQDPAAAKAAGNRGLSDGSPRDGDTAITTGRTAGAVTGAGSGEGAGRASDAAGKESGRDNHGARREATSAAMRENAASARTSAPSAKADATANDRLPTAPSDGTLGAASPTGPTSGALPATQLQRLAGAIAAGAADLRAQTGVAAAALAQPSLAGVHDPVRTLDLQMHPATLGLVTVRMRLVNQSLELRVRAANPETARLLKADSGKLADLLSTSGYGTHILAIDAGGADTAGFISSVPQPSAGLADGGAAWSGTGDQNRQQDRPSGGDGNGAPRGRNDFVGLVENADDTSSRDRPGAVYV